MAGVQVGATADCSRLGSEECQKQDGRRGDGAHSEAEKRISTQDTAPRAPRKLDTIFNWEFPLNTWPPAWVGYWCGSRARAPQLDSFEILWRFHAVFSQNAWTRTCLEFFPETGDIASMSWICTLLVWAVRIEMAQRSFPVWNSTGSGAERGKYAKNICCVDWRRSQRILLQDYCKAVCIVQSKRNLFLNSLKCRFDPPSRFWLNCHEKFWAKNMKTLTLCNCRCYICVSPLYFSCIADILISQDAVSYF